MKCICSVFSLYCKMSGAGKQWVRQSNTDSGSKRGVQCKDRSIMYLAFIIRNLF